MGLEILLGEDGKAHDHNYYIKKLSKMFPLLGRGLALPSLGLFALPSLGYWLDFFLGVTVGLLGLEVGVGPSSLGVGVVQLCGFIHNLNKNHTMTIISEGGGK